MTYCAPGFMKGDAHLSVLVVWLTFLTATNMMDHPAAHGNDSLEEAFGRARVDGFDGGNPA